MPTATRTSDRSVGASGTGDLRAVQVDQRMEKKKSKAGMGQRSNPLVTIGMNRIDWIE